MLRLIRNKFFILIVLTVVILVVMGLSSNQNSKLNVVRNATSVMLTPVQEFVYSTGEKINGTFVYFSDVKALKEENELYKAQIDELTKENKELLGYKAENERLRLALNIKDHFEDYEPIGANIIAKDMGNWFNIFTIDRGLQDGVSNNDAVVTSKGLVGRILSAELMSSKVISIIDEDSTVSARIVKTNEEVYVKGDMKLKDQGLCKANSIFNDVDIAVGDTIETSGLGGYYPKGITIGEVMEVRRKTGELFRYAIIKPAVDFKRLDEVFVLKSKKKVDNTGESEK